jgi:hypothetical protein
MQLLLHGYHVNLAMNDWSIDASLDATVAKVL